jgi:hypothetical protein
MYTLPLIMAQATILLSFTFVDPPKRTEINGNNSVMVVQRAIGGGGSYSTVMIFEPGFVLAGCYLAYTIRNLGEPKPQSKKMKGEEDSEKHI